MTLEAAVCVPDISTEGIFMRWSFHRIEIICQYYVPRHTAYGKIFRRPPLCISYRKNREWRVKPEEPPPVRAAKQSKYLNAYLAADFSQISETGRSFCFLGQLPRCRSPPDKFIVLRCYMNLPGRRKDSTHEY